MADPISASTLAIASLVTTAVGATVGTVSAISSASAQAGAARYQAAVARNNQTIATQNAQQAAQAGAVAGQSRDFRTRATLGAISAAQSASGVDSETGSSKEVMESAQELGRLDTSTIISNAMQTSRAYTAQGANFGAQSALDEATASNATTAGVVGAGTSLLGGASSFADKWLRYQTQGVPGFGSTSSKFGDWSAA